MSWDLPASIETERLVIRRYDPARDAEAYHARLIEDADHLRPWMPWAAHEPLSLEEHRAWLEQCAAWAAQGGHSYLGMFDRASGEFLGSAGLHLLDDDRGLEVGYWIGAEHQGRGLVTEAAVALTLVALLFAQAPVVEIYQRPDNVRSGGVAARAGFTHTGLASDTREGVPMERWTVGPDALLEGPLATAPLPTLRDADAAPLPWRRWRVPASLETERLVLRRYQPEDAAQVHSAILGSLDHLRPFIPWAAAEPLSFAAREEQMVAHASAFDAGEQFRFAMLDRETGEFIGGAGLHTRVGPEALEVGYWIVPDREGEGLVAEAVTALVGAARAAGASRVEIWCDPTNARSQRVAVRCGFTPVGTRRRGDLELAVWITDLGELAP